VAAQAVERFISVQLVQDDNVSGIDRADDAVTTASRSTLIESKHAY